MDDRVVEEYRRHQIVAAGSGSTFVGKAWKDGVGVLDVRGTSLDEVCSLLRAGIDKGLIDRANASPSPEIAKYVDAFRKLLPSLSDGHRAMLRAHYRAPSRCLTATQLADAAPYENYSAANLQYGMVGRMLWEELPTKLPIGTDGQPIYTFAIAEEGDRNRTEDQWVWRMRAEIAEALKQLGLD